MTEDKQGVRRARKLAKRKARAKAKADRLVAHVGITERIKETRRV